MRWILLVWILFAAHITATAQPVSLNSEHAVSLSDEERRWIVRHPVIRVGITPNWAPFSSFTDEGMPKGIDLEILRAIQQRTGLKFEIVPTRSWAETLKLAQ